MQVAFIKPGRTGYQYAVTERDIKWMEQQGWTRVEPPKPEPQKERKTLRLKDKQ